MANSVPAQALGIQFYCHIGPAACPLSPPLPPSFLCRNSIMSTSYCWQGRHGKEEYIIFRVCVSQKNCDPPSHVVMKLVIIIVTTTRKGGRTYVCMQQTPQHNSFLQSVICANASQKSFISDYRLCREMQGNSLEDNCLGLQSFRVHQLGNESRLIGSSAGSPLRKEEKWGWCLGRWCSFSSTLIFSQLFVATLPFPHFPAYRAWIFADVIVKCLVLTA